MSNNKIRLICVDHCVQNMFFYVQLCTLAITDINGVAYDKQLISFLLQVYFAVLCTIFIVSSSLTLYHIFPIKQLFPAVFLHYSHTI